MNIRPSTSIRLPSRSGGPQRPPLHLPVVLFAMIAMLATAGYTASRWLPPSFELVRSQNQVTVAEVLEIDPAGVLIIKPLADLYGDSSDIDSVRVPLELTADLETGQTYVIGLSTYRKNRLFRDGLEIDPEGPHAIEIVGVGTAVFADDPQLRALISAVRSDPAPPDLEVLELILELSKSQEPTLSRLAWTELFLRPDLVAHGQEKTAETCKEMLDTEFLDSEVRDRVLQISLRLPAALRSGWLVGAGRAVLTELSPTLDLASFDPALVKTALKVLEEDGSAADSEWIGPYLGSNNPGVVKSAIVTLDTLDPAAATSAARRALTQTDLHVSSRTALENYLNRFAADGSTI